MYCLYIWEDEEVSRKKLKVESYKVEREEVREQGVEGFYFVPRGTCLIFVNLYYYFLLYNFLL